LVRNTSELVIKVFVNVIVRDCGGVFKTADGRRQTAAEKRAADCVGAIEMKAGSAGEAGATGLGVRETKAGMKRSAMTEKTLDYCHRPQNVIKFCH
jgi:hypothetical protein